MTGGPTALKRTGERSIHFAVIISSRVWRQRSWPSKICLHLRLSTSSRYRGLVLQRVRALEEGEKMARAVRIACQSCRVDCAVIAHVKHGKVTRAVGGPNHPAREWASTRAMPSVFSRPHRNPDLYKKIPKEKVTPCRLVCG